MRKAEWGVRNKGRRTKDSLKCGMRNAEIGKGDQQQRTKVLCLIVVPAVLQWADERLFAEHVCTVKEPWIRERDGRRQKAFDPGDRRQPAEQPHLHHGALRLLPRGLHRRVPSLGEGKAGQDTLGAPQQNHRDEYCGDPFGNKPPRRGSWKDADPRKVNPSAALRSPAPRWPGERKLGVLHGAGRLQANGWPGVPSPGALVRLKA